MSRSDALSTLTHLADTGARLSREVRLPEVRLPDIDLSDLSLPEIPDVRLPEVSAPDLTVVTDTVRRRPSWFVIGAVGVVATLGIVLLVKRRRAADDRKSAELASVA